MAALPRGICAVCGDSVPVRRNGHAREHNYQGGPAIGKCKGSGRPLKQPAGFLERFAKVGHRKVGGSAVGRSFPADEITWRGQGLTLRSRPRQIDARATFHISSNQRLRTSGHTAAEFVDVEILEGALDAAGRLELQALMQACDTRPVVVRMRGEAVRP